MYIFNPEHDLCLANGDIHFVPPDSALAFGRDCASLTKYMQGLEAASDCDFPTIKKITPWGWNLHLRERLLKEGYPAELIATAEEIASITRLSHRENCTPCHKYIEERVEDTANLLLPHTYRITARNIEEVLSFLSERGNVVLKAPLSGSGKGIRFVSKQLSHSDIGWCKNNILKHHSVIVEKRYTPTLEFALLFKISKEQGVEFKGYSLFFTQNGAYRGNILGSNKYILEKIVEYIPKRMLLETIKAFKEYFSKNIAEEYEGFIGVDQFICTDYPSGEKLYYNPLVEINFRMTMGLLARNIFDNFSSKLQIQDGTHIFEIIRDKTGKSVNYRYEITPVNFPITNQRQNRI